MRDVTRLMLRVLDSDQFEPVGLLDILLPGADPSHTLRFTDAGKSVVFGGNTYSPINMARSEITEVLSSDSGEQTGVTLTINGIDGRMSNLLNQVELEGATVTYRQHDRRLLEAYPDRTRDAITLIAGEARNPVVAPATLILQVVSVMGLLDQINVPKRVYKSTCNATFGSASCGANIGAFTFNTTINHGSDTLALAIPATFLSGILSAGDANDYFQNGYVTFIDGLNALQSRPISRIQAGGGKRVIFVRYPFLNMPASGDRILVRRGCTKTKAACADRQGNAANFRGFEEVPYQIKPVILNGDSS